MIRSASRAICRITHVLCSEAAQRREGPALREYSVGNAQSPIWVGPIKTRLHRLHRHLVGADRLGGARHRLLHSQAHDVLPSGPALRVEARAGCRGGREMRQERQAQGGSEVGRQGASGTRACSSAAAPTCCSVRRRSPSVKMPHSCISASATSTQPQLRGAGAGRQAAGQRKAPGDVSGLHPQASLLTLHTRRCRRQQARQPKQPRQAQQAQHGAHLLLVSSTST